jgi:hypothetical protein
MKGSAPGCASSGSSVNAACALKHLSMQMSLGHLSASSQQEQSSAEASTVTSCFAAGTDTIPANIGSTAKLVASSTAMSLRIRIGFSHKSADTRAGTISGRRRLVNSFVRDRT